MKHLKPIISGTAGGTSYMKHLCIRFVPALPSMDPCSPAQIHIFQIGKMGFIKTTDQTHHLSLIDGALLRGEKIWSAVSYSCLGRLPFSGNSPAKCTVKSPASSRRSLFVVTQSTYVHCRKIRLLSLLIDATRLAANKCRTSVSLFNI